MGWMPRVATSINDAPFKQETQMTFALIVTFAFFAPVVATDLGNIAGLRFA